MTRRWSKTEVTYLKRYAKRKNTEELSQHFGVDKGSVLTKLQELGLSDGGDGSGTDPQLAVFEKALTAMHGGKWAAAVKGFEAAARDSEQMDLAARSRQFHSYCLRQLEAEPEAIEDPYLLAVVLRNRGDLKESLALCTQGKGRKDDEGFVYLAASIHALQGDLDASAERLRRAIELNPRNRIQAGLDTDFEELRATDAYSSIFAAD